ncbi:YdaU family protein [Phytobacter diazotrophicus]|uniref:YdaU family protein n=1 Tax=Phytobacter diazotrophicus TaxID=395631 RepID=UPI002FF5DF20
MAALPYMQLYIADYLADTMHLSTEEHGAYLLLMFNYWQTGRAIPKTRLAKIARMSNERWNSVEESLSEFFTDNGEEWVHDRIEQDLESVHAKLEQRSAAGKASVAKRKASKSTKSEREGNERSTVVENPLEQDFNENSTNKDKNKNKDIKELKDPPISPKGDGINKFEPQSVELPEWLPRDLWVEWVEFRRQLKKPIKTPRGVTESINRLDDFRRQGYQPRQVIQQSIANEWQGLFLPKDGMAFRSGARDVNAISEPDNSIPPGFRG